MGDATLPLGSSTFFGQGSGSCCPWLLVFQPCVFLARNLGSSYIVLLVFADFILTKPCSVLLRSVCFTEDQTCGWDCLCKFSYCHIANSRLSNGFRWHGGSELWEFEEGPSSDHRGI